MTHKRQVTTVNLSSKNDLVNSELTQHAPQTRTRLPTAKNGKKRGDSAPAVRSTRNISTEPKQELGTVMDMWSDVLEATT